MAIAEFGFFGDGVSDMGEHHPRCAKLIEFSEAIPPFVHGEAAGQTGISIAKNHQTTTWLSSQGLSDPVGRVMKQLWEHAPMKKEASFRQ
jgi:hypothetical protein